MLKYLHKKLLRNKTYFFVILLSLIMCCATLFLQMQKSTYYELDRIKEMESSTDSLIAYFLKNKRSGNKINPKLSAEENEKIYDTELKYYGKLSDNLYEIDNFMSTNTNKSFFGEYSRKYDAKAIYTHEQNVLELLDELDSHINYEKIKLDEDYISFIKHRNSDNSTKTNGVINEYKQLNFAAIISKQSYVLFGAVPAIFLGLFLIISLENDDVLKKLPFKNILITKNRFFMSLLIYIMYIVSVLLFLLLISTVFLDGFGKFDYYHISVLERYKFLTGKQNLGFVKLEYLKPYEILLRSIVTLVLSSTFVFGILSFVKKIFTSKTMEMICSIIVIGGFVGDLLLFNHRFNPLFITKYFSWMQMVCLLLVDIILLVCCFSVKDRAKKEKVSYRKVDTTSVKGLVLTNIISKQMVVFILIIVGLFSLFTAFKTEKYNKLSEEGEQVYKNYLAFGQSYKAKLLNDPYLTEAEINQNLENFEKEFEGGIKEYRVYINREKYPDKFYNFYQDKFTSGDLRFDQSSGYMDKSDSLSMYTKRYMYDKLEILKKMKVIPSNRMYDGIYNVDYNPEDGVKYLKIKDRIFSYLFNGSSEGITGINLLYDLFYTKFNIIVTLLSACMFGSLLSRNKKIIEMQKLTPINKNSIYRRNVLSSILSTIIGFLIVLAIVFAIGTTIGGIGNSQLPTMRISNIMFSAEVMRYREFIIKSVILSILVCACISMVINLTKLFIDNRMSNLVIAMIVILSIGLPYMVKIVPAFLPLSYIDSSAVANGFMSFHQQNGYLNFTFVVISIILWTVVLYFISKKKFEEKRK
ncbi:hypothetical protein [Finegoldia magna]|uniref:hypothetical protein n=1 Tax=Finegoldia magna TaxID=1260 RepID=UPI000B918151|nr:hypothetical protein [Finegoldia magna]OXZ32827.1 hypothetical protein B9N54_06875 [Finegoldia magna]